MQLNRRSLLQIGTASLGTSSLGMFSGSGLASDNQKPKLKVERKAIGAIGLRYQGSVITEKARQYGDIVALADVDRHVREQARASFGSTPRIFEDYQQLLQRDDIDVVLIASPDHWHAKMLIDAVRSGKDVYCEKPLTLTVDEGKVIRKVAAQSNRVIQVGTWQRSDSRFRLAVELVKAGRLGKLKTVTCTTDKNPTGGPFKNTAVPANLNWNLWLGQAPEVAYMAERCHYTFRWWYDYAGGKMTDWGAHHLDIAQWAIGSLPVEVESQATFTKIPNGYSVPKDFSADLLYENEVQLKVRDSGRRGILFEGDKGRIFVNRSSISGKPVEDLQSQPLPKADFLAYDYDNLQRPDRAGKLDAIINHMGNFFDCIDARKQPISDSESQHRSATTCHIANISMRLGRPLKWDPVREVFKDDAEANELLARTQREGFEVA